VTEELTFTAGDRVTVKTKNVPDGEPGTVVDTSNCKYFVALDRGGTYVAEPRNVARIGHPQHQMREFKVTARDPDDRLCTVSVVAQTEHDAVFRAGFRAARALPGYPESQWTVAEVTDPAKER
jgi:hypothetical protein